MTEWFHRIVVASTVGSHRQTVLEWDVIHPADGGAKNEGELTAAYRLLNTLYHTYHHQIQVIVADALYATRVFIRAVQQHGWDAVIRLKDERLTILPDAQDLLTITRPAMTQQLGHELANIKVICVRRLTMQKRGRRHRPTADRDEDRQGLDPADLWGRCLGPDDLSDHAPSVGQCWAILNFPTGKRLQPFLPSLVAQLERHGELILGGPKPRPFRIRPVNGRPAESVPMQPAAETAARQDDLVAIP